MNAMLRARSGVIDIPDMIMSILPFFSAGSSSANGMFTICSSTPMPKAISLARSASRPIVAPSRAITFSGGWSPDMPTRSVSVLTTRSSTLPASAGCASRTTAAATSSG